MFLTYLKSEQLKFWYNKWIVITACASFLFIPVLVATLNNFTAAQDINFAKTQLLQALYLGQTAFVVITVLYFGQEFSKSALRTGLLATPKRLLFLFSKGTCITALSFLFLIFSTVLSTFVLRFYFGVSLTADFLCQIIKAIIPAYLSTIQICIFTACLVVISKSIVFPLALMLSMILGLGHLLMQFCSIFKYLPVISAMNGFLLLPSNYYLPLWRGLFFQGIWCVILMLVASILFSLRCIK